MKCYEYWGSLGKTGLLVVIPSMTVWGYLFLVLGTVIPLGVMGLGVIKSPYLNMFMHLVFGYLQLSYVKLYLEQRLVIRQLVKRLLNDMEKHDE